MVGLTETWFLSLLLVLTRLTAFFTISPVFSYRNVPLSYRLGFSLAVSLLAVTQVASGSPELVFGGFYLGLVLKEVFVGLILGFTASVVFAAIQMAGAMIDLKMGFALANLVDPQSGAPMPVTANLKFILAMLFFLAIDGHHQLIQGILASFQLVPVDFIGLSGFSEAMEWLARFFSQAFLIALQIAAPMAAALFLVDVAMGIIARTVPQMNFFVIGFPLKMLFGIMILLFVVPGFFIVLTSLFQRMFESMSQMMQWLGI